LILIVPFGTMEMGSFVIALSLLLI
jgi:hypothetical protein